MPVVWGSYQNYRILFWARICIRLRSPGIDTASLCILSGRWYVKWGFRTGPLGCESIPALLKMFTNTGSDAKCWKGDSLLVFRHTVDLPPHKISTILISDSLYAANFLNYPWIIWKKTASFYTVWRTNPIAWICQHRTVHCIWRLAKIV